MDGSTKSELVGMARGKGFKFSQSTLDKWIGLGIVDFGGTIGTGRGSTASRWSEEQARLLLEMLRLREQKASRPDLAGIAVGVWLLSGERYVPLRQVRRAASTWAADALRPKGSVRQVTFRALRDDFGFTGRSRVDQQVIRDRLDELAAIREPDFEKYRAELRKALTNLVLSKGESVGTTRIEAWLTIISARHRGALALRDQRISDDEFSSLRSKLRTASAEYAQQVGRQPSEVRKETVLDAPLSLSLVIGLEQSKGNLGDGLHDGPGVA